jgi:hypothetical protein
LESSEVIHTHANTHTYMYTHAYAHTHIICMYTHAFNDHGTHTHTVTHCVTHTHKRGTHADTHAHVHITLIYRPLRVLKFFRHTIKRMRRSTSSSWRRR